MVTACKQVACPEKVGDRMQEAGQNGAHPRDLAGAFCPKLEPISSLKAQGPEECGMSPGNGGLERRQILTQQHQIGIGQRKQCSMFVIWQDMFAFVCVMGQGEQWREREECP